jgi:hypothetical protein
MVHAKPDGSKALALSRGAGTPQVAENEDRMKAAPNGPKPRFASLLPSILMYAVLGAIASPALVGLSMVMLPATVGMLSTGAGELDQKTGLPLTNANENFDRGARAGLQLIPEDVNQPSFWSISVVMGVLVGAGWGYRRAYDRALAALILPPIEDQAADFQAIVVALRDSEKATRRVAYARLTKLDYLTETQVEELKKSAQGEPGDYARYAVSFVENRVKELTRLGSNVAGVVQLNARHAPVRPEKGPVGVLSQSGADDDSQASH